MRRTNRHGPGFIIWTLVSAAAAVSWWPAGAQAVPLFARQYDMSCVACHSAFPRLNAFGEHFRDQGMRLPNWRETTVDTGDERLALPRIPPIAFRAQAFVQGREGEEIDPVTGPTGNEADFDFQAPYLIKLLSSAPLSDNITYYFYGIFAEKGGNGETVIEDAWFSHGDLFGSGVGLQLGQFQVSDLMFPRETRLTFQDFMVYRMAEITYDRGVLFDRGLGPVSVAVGAVNGNGIEENFDVNSPGFRRPDNMFDNDQDKSVFGRVGVELGPATVGLFALSGEQANATGPAGTDSGDRETDKEIYGVDLRGRWGAKTYWFAQALWNRWDDFLAPGQTLEWDGGFAGVDYILNDRWALSMLYNYADAGDLAGTGTVFEGIEINTLTLGASYYFMRNVKGLLELNADLQDEDDDPDFVGHETKEGYVLVGFDAAF
ncbi:MAG: hypothetical protein GWO02_07910 [Gammaproteobacteria bacterium]|nr:hypothetical protein [Gammaproteobacteria bacterium]